MSDWLAALQERYAAKGDQFTLTLPYGEAFTFRAVSDYVDLKALKASAKAFVEAIQKGPQPPEWAGLYIGDPELLHSVFMISELSLDPKLSQLDVLRLARHAVFVFEFFKNGIDDYLVGRATAIEAGGIDAAKNESSEIPCGD